MIESPSPPRRRTWVRTAAGRRGRDVAVEANSRLTAAAGRGRPTVPRPQARPDLVLASAAAGVVLGLATRGLVNGWTVGCMPPTDRLATGRPAARSHRTDGRARGRRR